MKWRRSYPLEVEPGRVLRRYSQEEALALADQWIDVYARNAQGANIKAYLWHTFSFGAYPSACKHEAQALYEQQVSHELVVLSNDRQAAVLTDVLPTCCGESDWLVFPPNLAWTMAFTHEDGWLGPYFAKHQKYDVLVSRMLEEARARERKEKEIERAKREGWA